MGSSNSNEAEVSAMPKKLNVDSVFKKSWEADLDRLEKDKEAERQQRAKEAERQRALDAETIPLNMNGPAHCRKCLQGHALKPFTTDLIGYSCSGCAEIVPVGSEFMSCRDCDFDLCSTCAGDGPDGKFDVDARLNGTLQELTEKVVLKLGLTKECAKDVEMHLSGYKLEPVTKIVREFTELCAGSEIDLEGIQEANEAMEVMKQKQAAEVNETDSFGCTQLHRAAQMSDLAAISRLLSAKAEVNKTAGYNGETPLGMVSQPPGYGQSDQARQLLRDAGGHY